MPVAINPTQRTLAAFTDFNNTDVTREPVQNFISSLAKFTINELQRIYLESATRFVSCNNAFKFLQNKDEYHIPDARRLNDMALKFCNAYYRVHSENPEILPNEEGEKVLCKYSELLSEIKLPDERIFYLDHEHLKGVASQYFSVMNCSTYDYENPPSFQSLGQQICETFMNYLSGNSNACPHKSSETMIDFDPYLINEMLSDQPMALTDGTVLQTDMFEKPNFTKVTEFFGQNMTGIVQNIYQINQALANTLVEQLNTAFDLSNHHDDNDNQNDCNSSSSNIYTGLAIGVGVTVILFGFGAYLYKKFKGKAPEKNTSIDSKLTEPNQSKFKHSRSSISIEELQPLNNEKQLKQQDKVEINAI